MSAFHNLLIQDNMQFFHPFRVYSFSDIMHDISLWKVLTYCFFALVILFSEPRLLCENKLHETRAKIPYVRTFHDEIFGNSECIKGRCLQELKEEI